jgi:hypothetical protein
MNNFKMSKKLLPLMLLPFANMASATTEQFTVGFTTLPAITIGPVTAMAFGQVLKLPNGSVCTMLAGGTHFLGTASVEKSGTPAAGGTPGAMAGSCAGGDDGTLGVYEVAGLAGTDVTLTLLGETNVDIQFEPVGYTWDFNNNAYIDLDNTGSDTYQIADGSDGTATVTPGVSRIILGGTITNQRVLLAGDNVTANFTIDVNY